MARQTTEKKDFTFIGGLNTEAGFLTFPENAWLDGDNVIPNLDGSVSRRMKLDYEQDSTLPVEAGRKFSTSEKQQNAFGGYLWEAAGGDGNKNFVVIQQGSIINFYGIEEGQVLSNNAKYFEIDLSAYLADNATTPDGFAKADFASGNGNLIIVADNIDPILVIYDAVVDAISVEELTLKIRDFYGADDGLEITENPATLSAEHEYNLLNQGWISTHITAYETANSVYPDNTQIWVYGKDSSDVFTAALLDKQDFGTTPAPKGRFILDVFNRDRSTASGVSGITTETETSRPNAAAFFAGRVWYAGFTSPTLASWVLFSQVATDNNRYAKCYQDADPTSEFIFDLVSDDGGVIPIAEAAGISKLVATQDSLLVFARNGIWQILGDSGGFKADGYQVKKITRFGCISSDSIIELENNISYWSESGIYVLKKDAVSGDFAVAPLSLERIQTFYNDIPLLGKQRTAALYDRVEKKVMWLFNDNPNEDGETDRFKKNRFLVLDTRIGAFYTYTIAELSADSPECIFGVFVQQSGSGESKFITLAPNGSDYSIMFSDFITEEDTPTRFKDWYSADGVGEEAAAYLITGYQMAGSHVVQAPYITTFLKRTETGFDSNMEALNSSSVILQGRWEWTDNATPVRWTAGEEIYRKRALWAPSVYTDDYADGYPLVVAKTKLRGKGKTLSLKFTAGTGKEMQIVGWSIIYNVNANL